MGEAQVRSKYRHCRVRYGSTRGWIHLAVAKGHSSPRGMLAMTLIDQSDVHPGVGAVVDRWT